MVNGHPLGTIWHPLEGPGILHIHMNGYKSMFFSNYTESFVKVDSATPLPKGELGPWGHDKRQYMGVAPSILSRWSKSNEWIAWLPGDGNTPMTLLCTFFLSADVPEFLNHPFLFDVLKIDPNSGWKLFHLESNLRVEEDNPGTLRNHGLNLMYEK